MPKLSDIVRVTGENAGKVIDLTEKKEEVVKKIRSGRLTRASKPDKKVKPVRSVYGFKVKTILNKETGFHYKVLFPKSKLAFTKGNRTVERARIVPPTEVLEGHTWPTLVRRGANTNYHSQPCISLSLPTNKDPRRFRMSISVYMLKYFFGDEIPKKEEKDSAFIVLFKNNGFNYITLMKHDQFLPDVDFVYPLAKLDTPVGPDGERTTAAIPITRTTGHDGQNLNMCLYALMGNNYKNFLKGGANGLTLRFTDKSSYCQIGDVKSVRLQPINKVKDENIVYW